MKKLMIVVGDCNDADFLTEISDITGLNEEDLTRLKRITSLIKERTDNEMADNWNTREMDEETPESVYGDKLSEEDIEFFEGFIPHGEFGIHSIDSIMIYTIESEEQVI